MVFRTAWAVPNRWIFAISFMVLTLAPTPSSWGQPLRRIEIPSSFNPVGSGARALSMGGAFIAIADDATAASWNPGGLIQLDRPELSVVGDFFHRIEDNTFGGHPEANGAETVDQSGLNYFSAAYPFAFRGYNMIVSLNYQHLFDFTRQWSFPIHIGSGADSFVESVEHRQEGRLSALGLAYCIQLTPSISFGLTFNIWNDDLTQNSWDVETFQRGGGTDSGDAFLFDTRTVEDYTLSGWNMNLGAMWNINRFWTLGAVVKTPFDAEIDHTRSRSSVILFPDLPGFGSKDSNRYAEDGTLEMPLSVGIGAAYRFSDLFSMSMDIFRTWWDDFEYEDGDGRKTSPISGRPIGESDTKATYQVRVGAEYLFVLPKYVIPIRGGLFYDPAPAEGNPDDFYGFSAGSGISFERFSFDVGYQYRFGRDSREYLLEDFAFSQDINEYMGFASIILYF